MEFGDDDAVNFETSILGRNVLLMQAKLDTLLRCQEDRTSLRRISRRTSFEAAENGTRSDQVEGHVQRHHIAFNGITSIQPLTSIQPAFNGIASVQPRRFSNPTASKEAEEKSTRLHVDSHFRRHPHVEDADYSSTKRFPWSQAIEDAKKDSKYSLKLREFSWSHTSRARSGKMMLPSISLSPGHTLSTISPNTRYESWYASLMARIFPLGANSKFVLTLDALSVVVLWYDCITIPYLLTWDVPMEGFFLWMAILTGCFWLLDMAMHFMKTFTKDGEPVTDSRQIACHYLRGRFTFDAFTVACDWIGIALDVSEASEGRSPVYRFTKFGRVLKFSRVLRLITLWRIGQFSHLHDILMMKLYNRNLYTTFMYLGNSLRLVFFILLFNHIAACIFVAMITSSWRDTGKGWELSISQMHGGSTFANAGLSDEFQYFIAYYWSITTMFSGSSFLTPMSTLESAFSVAYVLFGVLFAGTIISSMAAMQMEHHAANRSRNKNMYNLRRYLKQENIDATLSLAVLRQASERMASNIKLTESDVFSCIAMLAPELRDRLRYKIWHPVVEAQPFWKTCCYLDMQLIKNLCKFGLKVHPFSPGHIVFESRTPMVESLILIWGKMNYSLDESMCRYDEDSGACDGEDTIEPEFSQRSMDLEEDASESDGKVCVSARQQICEAALWIQWSTVGSLEGAGHGEYLSCDSQVILEVVVPSNVKAQVIMRSYAEALLEYINVESPLRLSDLSSSMDFDLIVSLMEQDQRVLMYQPVLKALKIREPRLTKVWNELEDEVRRGVCNLGYDGEGGVLRTVKVVALHLSRDDGCMCLNIGEFTRDSMRAKIDWPGAKMRPREPLVNCTNQLIQKHFPEWAFAIGLDHYHMEATVRTSEDYQIQTKYLRTVVRAHTGFYTQTETVHWGSDVVECFALKKSQDTCRVYAWLSHHQYQEIVDKCEEGEKLLSGWIQSVKEQWLVSEKSGSRRGSYGVTVTQI